MKTARYGSIHGPQVDPIEFHTRATARPDIKGIFPYCDSCHEIVHLYGVHTPNPDTVPRFDHSDLLPDADPLDDCVLADRNPRFRGLYPDGYDDLRGERIRAQFFEPEFLAQGYAFCRDLCRKGNLSAKKFRSMLRRADRKRIWAYVDIEVWSIPYILLTLENFSARSKNGHEYEFHFVFRKPRGSSIAALWTHQQDCRIVKVFSRNGEEVQAGDNPYPVSEAAFAEKNGDTAWITAELLRALTP